MAPKLTFYLMPPSPPSRALRYLAEYLGLDFEVKEINTAAGEQFSEDFTKINPAQKIPVMVEDDFVLAESKAIMVYLMTTRKPESDLYPSDPKARALVDQMLYYDATVMFPAFFTFVRPAAFDGVKKTNEAHKDGIRKALKTLNVYLEGQEYIAGKNLTIADISILANVSVFVEFGYNLSQYSNLKKWYENLSRSLPHFDKFLEDATKTADMLRTMYEDQLY